MPGVMVDYNDVVELLEHLGEIVKQEREKRDLGLPTAADEIGIPFPLLWAIEHSGAEVIGIETLVKLLRWLGRG